MQFHGQYKADGFDFGDGRERLLKHCKFNVGKRFILSDFLPESNKQRRFFEGAVIPMITYYQEGMDHRNSDDCRRVHEWVKMEFCPEIVVIKGKTVKVPGSTKGKLQEFLVEKVLDWMSENGYKVELLVPDDYKHWKDIIYSSGGADNYIDYLREIGKI